MRRSDRERKMVVEITNMGIIAVFFFFVFFVFFLLDPMITVGYQSEVERKNRTLAKWNQERRGL